MGPPDLRGGGCSVCVWEGWEHQDVMRPWRELSAAAGGDLFACPRKLSAMREVDRTRPREGSHPMTEASWRAYHDAVTARIAALPPEPAPGRSLTAVPVVRRGGRARG